MFNFKVNPEKDKEDLSTSRTSSNRPAGLPRSDKDFKKVLSSKERDRRNSEDDENPIAKESIGEGLGFEEVAYTEEAPKQQPSLFDLSKGINKKEQAARNEEVADMASSDELPMNSIFKNLALKEKAQAQSKGKLERTKGSQMGAVDEDDEPSMQVSSFARESIDLSSINPQASNQQMVSEINDPKVDRPVASQKMTTLQLVDAIVKAIATMDTQGKTDTIVTLKHPPMFSGANLVLTSYESAKGEFNIRFENMSHEGKSFMDMQQNQDSLRFALQERGYAIHIVVVTTEIETPTFLAEAQQTREGKPEDQSPEQEQPRKRQQREQA